ncbi:cysteamine dioxygenase [Handroanthus impetiginosus]|uniref:cysteine dioxygenase n=1 Tax=Handroanthus impetiginosus TaxID=429701 RepID=A0A2G9HFQ9_9LAMI|nr:cysteamine dioxygenase [Handroanthus impetiginosus]
MQMGIEQRRSGGKDQSRKSKRRQKKLSPIQRLIETCEEVFADCGPGIVPSPEKVEKLAAVLDGMTPADVDLGPNKPYFNSNRAPVITYRHIHECDKFSIGIFCLPPTSVIPLHNHPEMTVFSKLLFGTMHIKAYDWVNEVDKNTDQGAIADAIDPSHPDGSRLAKLKVNAEFTAPCGTSILYPADGGNMHCFTARTACAVLDVLGPPYCDPEGRHCQYYFEFPVTKLSDKNVTINTGNNVAMPDEEEEGYAWLKERDNPEDLAIVGESYSGRKIAKK